MKKYHKIQTVFKHNPETKFRTLLKEYALPEFEYLANNEWIFTEKVDGINIRVMFRAGVVFENEAAKLNFVPTITFGSKTDRAQMPPFLLKKLNEKFLPQLELFKENFPDGVCLYGEGYGAKIRKSGGNYRQDQDFILFDVKIGDWWLKRQDVDDIARQLNIDTVPIIGYGTLTEMVRMARNGLKSKWGNFQAEGIVARPTIELKTRAGHRIITKIKCEDFKVNPIAIS